MPLTSHERERYEQLRQVNEAANSNLELGLELVLREDDKHVSNIVFLARRSIRRLDEQNHEGLEEALAKEKDQTFVFRMRELLECATANQPGEMPA